MTKKHILLGICGAFVGFILGAIIFGSNVKYKKMVKEARLECIKYNNYYNEIYDAAARNYFVTGNQIDKYTVSIIQHDFPYLMAINKALHIDCRDYDEDGEVIMIKNENGELNPMEKLPDELKII